jgi:acetate kinase
MSRTVAVLNTGSSSVKAALFDLAGEEPEALERIVRPVESPEAVPRVVRDALAGLERSPDALGHRLVHGGRQFLAPTLLSGHVEETLESLVPLAPLHLGPALAAIREARRIYPRVPAVAVFDTTFHAGRPPDSMHYALPRELTRRFGFRRYGFHGLAHRSLAEQLAAGEGLDRGAVSAVTLQLGAGCSACAVRDGRSIETSMGHTPLEGLVMTTRSGDVDPAIVIELARAGLSPDRIERELTQRSGVLGLAGRGDMRDVVTAAAAGDAAARLALEVFCRRIVLTVGGYFTLLGGAAPLVFGGGIGANSPEIRAQVAGGLAAWNMALDPERNGSATPGRISADGTTPVYAFETDEERVIARAVATFLESGNASPSS